MPEIKSIYGSDDLMQIPSIQEAVKEILQSNPPKEWHKPCLALLLMTGARISEIIELRKKDFHFFNENGVVVDPLDSGTNVYKLIINLVTKKKRSEKKVFRRIPILFRKNNDEPSDLEPLLPILLVYLKTIKEDEALLFLNSRITVNWLLKKYVNSEFYPHLFRHIQATNDALGGMNEFVMAKKFGWKDIRPATSYVSLLAEDIEKEQQRVYDKRTIHKGSVLSKKEPMQEKSVDSIVIVKPKPALVEKEEVDIVF